MAGLMKRAAKAALPGAVVFASGAGAGFLAEQSVSRFEMAQKQPYLTPLGLFLLGLAGAATGKPILKAAGVAMMGAGGLLTYQTFRMRQNAEQASGGGETTQGVVRAPETGAVVNALPEPSASGLESLDGGDAGAVDFRSFAGIGRRRFMGY